MNRLLSTIAAALLVASACVAADIDGDTFHLTLPAEYSAPVKTVTNKDGIQTTVWVAKAPTGEAVVASVSKLTGKVGDPAKLLDSTRDSLIKSVNGTLESEQNVPGDFPSRIIIFRSGNAFLRSRLALVGDQLYDVLYVGRTEEQRNLPAVAQIFDSFKIVQPAQTSSAPPPH
jgi:hypothetical protein